MSMWYHINWINELVLNWNEISVYEHERDEDQVCSQSAKPYIKPTCRCGKIQGRQQLGRETNGQREKEVVYAEYHDSYSTED